MRRWITAPTIRSAISTSVMALALGAILYVGIAFADGRRQGKQNAQAPERARYASPDQAPYLRFTPVDLANGSKLTLISPSQWSDLADQLVQALNKTHAEYTDLFSTIPAFSSSIRLMDETAFYELTGAPGWTNAMFFRGQIIIPLSNTKPVDVENLHRSVKHEFTHAVLSALSGGQIPGWIDEGIAQWSEGYENPALREALRTWLNSNEPVALSLLQGGFTKLNSDMVPAAYAQSLLATKALIHAFGFSKIGAYLALLRTGTERSTAFREAFGLTLEQFEEKLGESLKTWAALPEPAV